MHQSRTIAPQDFNQMSVMLRSFFAVRGYLETFPQPRLSILAACEDPKTVRSFVFGGEIWPLPQTGQMHLEGDLLSNANELDGVYCFTASYRDEPNPIPGRHDLSFPMFEFEHKGEFTDLIETLSELTIHLGIIKSLSEIKTFTYNELCTYYGVKSLEAEHEMMMWQDFGDVVAITNFPANTHPFWNMLQDGKDGVTGEQLYNKCDFIIKGQETFGSAERSCNVNQMRDNFHSISDGMYAKLLYNEFKKERVEQELEEYLSLKMIPRFGCGIGMTRLFRAIHI